MKIFPLIKKKKILILGLGKEGLSTYFFLRKRFPDKVLTLADSLTFGKLPKDLQLLPKKDKKINFKLGRGYLRGVRGFGIVFVSPGISDSNLEKVRGAQTIVSTNLELFFELCRGKIIGVTGTKGKSTTTSLIYRVLKQGGLDVRIAGNIGEPALSFLEKVKSDTIFVLELSSYQLMRLYKSPSIAVIQNIVPEHLDYHGSFTKYIKAKENIVKFQNKKDFVIYNSKSIIATKIAQKSPGKKIPFNDFTNEIEESIIPIVSIPLKGKFNLQNVLPAILIGRMFDVPDKKIAKAIKSFKPLEHRLEYVAVVNGVEYYNDSLSTIPESAIAAMDSFPGKYKILILGGYDRGLDFSNLAKKIKQEKIRGIILFPTTGERIWQDIKKEFKDKNLPLHLFTDKIRKAIGAVHEWSKKGDVVLLSPASPSFSMFKNYKDRGDQFKKEVYQLSQKNI